MVDAGISKRFIEWWRFWCQTNHENTSAFSHSTHWNNYIIVDKFTIQSQCLVHVSCVMCCWVFFYVFSLCLIDAKRNECWGGVKPSFTCNISGKQRLFHLSGVYLKTIKLCTTHLWWNIDKTGFFFLFWSFEKHENVVLLSLSSSTSPTHNISMHEIKKEKKKQTKREKSLTKEWKYSEKSISTHTHKHTLISIHKMVTQILNEQPHIESVSACVFVRFAIPTKRKAH